LEEEFAVGRKPTFREDMSMEGEEFQLLEAVIRKCLVPD
jgi:hypothetical protein